jgi:hypothetical protein
MEELCDLRCLAVDDYLLTIAEMNLGPNCDSMKATCVRSDAHPPAPGQPVNRGRVQRSFPAHGCIA